MGGYKEKSTSVNKIEFILPQRLKKKEYELGRGSQSLKP